MIVFIGKQEKIKKTLINRAKIITLIINIIAFLLVVYHKFNRNYFFNKYELYNYLKCYLTPAQTTKSIGDFYNCNNVHV